MNVKQLSKNIGQLFRLRPKPFRIDADGTRLPQLDDTWRLDDVREAPARVCLANTRTQHTVELESDNVLERRSPDFLLLRCQLTLRSDGLDIEPIHKGAPIQPESHQLSKGGVAGPTYRNLPAGYERRLNYHRYRLLKDKASRNEVGGHKYPVHVKGSDPDIHAFAKDVAARWGVFPMITHSTDEVTALEFTYVGSDGPEVIEDTALYHHLTVLRCGNSFSF